MILDWMREWCFASPTPAPLWFWEVQCQQHILSESGETWERSWKNDKWTVCKWTVMTYPT